MSADDIRRWFEDNAGPDAGDMAVRMVYKLLDEHKPIGIYDECGHSHHPDEPGVKDINDVGLVCAEGLTYEVCASCCDWNPVSGQTEHCASEHDHHFGGAHCLVVYTIGGVINEPCPPVSSQDTPPAPRTAREPRQFWNSDPEPEDVDKVRDDALGYVWARNDRNGLWYSDGAAPRPWGSLPTEITEVLSESVSTDTDGADR